MMVTSRNNVAAVMATCLFFFGCGPDNGMDSGMTDAGPDVMTDGGDPMVDAGPDSMVDSGMLDGGDPMVCTPSDENQMCRDATDCACDMSGLADRCRTDPIICDTTSEERNYCVPGVNRCGDDNPVSMMSYSVDPDLLAQVRAVTTHAMWFGPGGWTLVTGFFRNGQWIIVLHGREYAFGHEGKAWDNWGYENTPSVAPYDGLHGTLVFNGDFTNFFREDYRGWRGQTEPDERELYILE